MFSKCSIHQFIYSVIMDPRDLWQTETWSQIAFRTKTWRFEVYTCKRCLIWMHLPYIGVQWPWCVVACGIWWDASRLWNSRTVPVHWVHWWAKVCSIILKAAWLKSFLFRLAWLGNHFQIPEHFWLQSYERFHHGGGAFGWERARVPKPLVLYILYCSIKLQ